MKHISLRAARERAALTQLELEELSGVDRTRISRLESAPESANPTIDTFHKLDRALRERRGLRRGEQLHFGSQTEALAS